MTICRALIGCKGPPPPNFRRGLPQKGTSTFHVEHFNHLAIIYTTLLEQKKVLNGKNVHLPREWFGKPKWLCFHCSGIQRVRSIGNLKSGFRICNRRRNPKTDLNAEISVFGFPFYRSIGKSEKGFQKLSLRTVISCTRTHN